MVRERKTIVVGYVAQPGLQLFDQLGRIVGQTLSCRQCSDDTWEIEVDVEADTDVDRLQVMPDSGITGSINNG